MTEPVKPLFYEFADFHADVEKRLLWRGADQISLTPKVFETLLIFLEHRGEVLLKERLMNLLWSDSFVEEANLAQNVAVLRKVLGEDSKQHKYILTIPGRGYRFVAHVKEIFPDRGTVVSGNYSSDGLDQLEEFDETVVPPKIWQRNTKWLLVAVPLALVVVAFLALWLFINYNKTDQTPTINKTTQITTWSGLDFYPSISTEGNAIAFSSDRTGSFEIYVKQFVVGAREVQLTFDAGQNFEPSFSPNGSLIAYYSKKRGGIWVIPVTGGVAKQITEFGSHPAWSPEGSQIVFQSDPLNDVGFNVYNGLPPSTIWTVSADRGEPKQITQPGNPAGGHGAPSWSPNGKRIVFDSGSSSIGAVWSISSDGGEMKRISGDLQNASDAIYSPDGSYIYFVSDRGAALQRVHISETDDQLAVPVKIVDASGSRIRHLSIGAGGKSLVYSSLSTSSDIRLSPVSPTENTAKDNSFPISEGKNTRNSTPTFSPDGKRIAYVFYSVGSTFQIWVADTDGNNKTQLTIEAAFPSWFPDGSRIAYNVKGDNRYEFWSISVDGGLKRKLFDFDGESSFSRLSPDAKHVAFNSLRSGTINIWTVPIEGGSSTQITFDKESAGFPSWSPDGRWLAYEIRNGEDSHICIIPAEGGQPIQLTNETGQSWPGGWSPDGDKIIFAGQRDGLWNLYSVSRSTKSIARMTNFSKINSYVRYPAWSPRNDKVAYEYAETTGNIWMIELK